MRTAPISPRTGPDMDFDAKCCIGSRPCCEMTDRFARLRKRNPTLLRGFTLALRSSRSCRGGYQYSSASITVSVRVVLPASLGSGDPNSMLVS
jgi:hypothetical protein